MEFKDFLIHEYCISEGSAEDYVGRLNGILKRNTLNLRIITLLSLKGIFVLKTNAQITRLPIFMSGSKIY
ncbi:hypothetical protein BA202_01560 [Bacillus cereus]|nr:hypothetical protein BA202_01560 [Bacillus cereus]